jgi:hypothetical protein
MALFRTFKRPTGIVGWFLLLWALVGTWSRAEFLLGKARRLAPIMPLILDVLVSSWFRLTLVVVGLTLIWLSTRPKIGSRLTGASKARELLSELAPSLEAMLTGADAVWVRLSHNAQRNFGPPLVLPLTRLIDKADSRERRKVRQAAGELIGRLRAGDPRPFVVPTYTSYREWRAEIIKLAKMTVIPIEATHGYLEWADAERRFLSDLHEKLEALGLEAEQRVLKRYDDRHGPPGPLSPD